MNFTKTKWQSWLTCLSIPGALFALTVAGVGCNSTGGGTTTGGDNNAPLSFDGTISGKLVDTQSTRASLEDDAPGQAVPPDFDTGKTTVRFRDMAGNDLLDPQGNPIGEVTVNADGSFTAEDLPVGIDFTVCGDIDQDGDCDIESCVQIPADENGTSGTLIDVQSDPLTTVVLARLRQIIDELDINVDNLPISPAVVVARVSEAYENLFEDSGVDHALTLDEISDVATEVLARIFQEQIPIGAQAGLQIVEGNLEASKAGNAEELALSVAEVFLRAGFPIIDFPGGVDLSTLGQLDGITTTTESELFGGFELVEEFDEFDQFIEDLPPELLDQFGGVIPEDFSPELLNGFSDEMLNEFLSAFPDGTVNDLGGFGLAEADGIIYINSIAEPDRNFGLNEEEGKDGLPPMPLLSDHILLQMARLQSEGRRISLANLHALLTDIDGGLGARLTYFLEDPNFFGPPLTVFETADGKGKAINMEKLFARIFDAGFGKSSVDDFENNEQQVRLLMKDLLRGTIPPTFERMFEGILAARLEGIHAVTRNIREARAHLPFNNSGPSSFFVLADGDAFRGDVVSAVTVDVEVSREGIVNNVVYNPTGDGKYYLAFSRSTEDDGTVEFLVRETGRFLHGSRGPARASIYNESIFQPVNGLPFSAMVSETGVFYPGMDVPIIRNDFSFGGGDEFGGSTEYLFVLATNVGFGAEPVRVDYDPATGVATFNPGGRYLLTFLQDSEETGIFGLFNEDTGRDAGTGDPIDFFDVQAELPVGFEDFFNEIDFDEFDAFNDTDQFINDVFNEFDSTGTLPPPPDDGMLPPPPDGTLPPPGDGTQPPPPNDGTIPPAEALDPVFVDFEPILIDVNAINGLVLGKREFSNVFGTDAPNLRFDASRDPFFDDANDNGIQDEGESTSPFRPTLFDPGDWRSTDIRLYYRLASGGEVAYDAVDFESLTPATLDGEALVTRNYLPRLNAFKFGRPNTAINLLTAFAPANFFNGTKALTKDTVIDIFSAIALINLAMDQVFNVVGNIDIDGLGPLPRKPILTDAQLFVTPIGDPFLLLVEGFKARSAPVRDGVRDAESITAKSIQQRVSVR